MSPKNYLLVASFLCLLVWTHQSYASATSQSQITITYPTTNLFISSNDITITGTVSSPDSHPTIYFSVDGGSSITPFVYQNTWHSYQTVHIGNGWHTLNSVLSDSNGIQKTSVQFLISSGHITTTKYSVIAIEYSETCQKLIDSKSNSTCPSIKELKQYDTSNTNLSGQFVMKKDGTWIRTNPQSPNHITFYTDPTNIKVCVDCKVNLASPDIMQTLFIEPEGFSYVKHNFSTESIPNTTINSTINENSIDASLTVFYDRYVDDYCITGNMDYSHDLMIDTIGYLKSGCTITHFNKTSTSLIPFHAIDYKNTPQLVYNKYIQDSLKVNKGNCITVKCSTVKNPQAKW